MISTHRTSTSKGVLVLVIARVILRISSSKFFELFLVIDQLSLEYTKAPYKTFKSRSQMILTCV